MTVLDSMVELDNQRKVNFAKECGRHSCSVSVISAPGSTLIEPGQVAQYEGPTLQLMK